MAYGSGQDGYDDDGNLWPPEYAKAVKERDELKAKNKELKGQLKNKHWKWHRMWKKRNELRTKLHRLLTESKKIAHSDLPIHVDQIIYFESVITEIES